MTLRMLGSFLVIHDRGFYGRTRSGFGFSLEWVAKDYRPLFSERNGYRKARYLGRLRLEVLR